ncbi:MAG: RNA polymerase sigma factor [Pseudomonadota bacterium]
MKLTRKVVKFFCAVQQRERFNMALEAHYERLYRLAFAWTHQPCLAQDLVQETMLKALENQGDLDSFDQFGAWLSKIMHNKFIDNLRYNRRWEWADEAEVDHCLAEASTESKLIQSQTQDSLHNAMSKLSFEHRQAISLSDIQGFSYLEISDITSTPIGTVMSRISRGREKLRLLLGKSHSEQRKVVPLRGR